MGKSQYTMHARSHSQCISVIFDLRSQFLKPAHELAPSLPFMISDGDNLIWFFFPPEVQMILKQLRWRFLMS